MEMKPQTQKEIENVKTLKEYFEVIEKNFNTLECKPGNFVKATLVYVIVSKLSGTNILVSDEVRQKVSDSKNIQEFIDIIKLNFNLNNQITNTKQLVYDLEKLLRLTNLKEK
jgi:hypothetical protein